MKKIILAGNWKMNHGMKETKAFLSALDFHAHASAEMRLYLPFLSLATGLEVIQSKKMQLQMGAQNAHFEKSGAFTGEVSAPMLIEAGIKQVLIGHSERRQYFNETNESVLKKTVSCLTQGLEVLVCIGETGDERNQNLTEKVLLAQLSPLLENETCLGAFGTTLHLAYEPVWAIGTGVTATPKQAEDAHAFIRGLLLKKLSPAQAATTGILYGGSVTPANFKELLACPNIDGGLVGGASLKLESWLALWNIAIQA